MADKTNANIGFEKQLWDAACVLWGHIPAAEYRKVIIGLIFLRYISAAFDKRREELIEEGDGFEDDRAGTKVSRTLSSMMIWSLYFLFQRKLDGATLRQMHIHQKSEALSTMRCALLKVKIKH